MRHERVSLAEAYRGRWSEILVALGIPANALVNRHGPCPVPGCGGKDRFRYDNKDGRGTWICSHCGAGDGPRLVMLVLGVEFAEAADRVRAVAGGERWSAQAVQPARPVEREETPAGKLRHMNDLWTRSAPIAARDPAGIYLTRRLGAFPIGTGLRFVDRCSYPKGGDYPAMLARFVGQDGRPTGLHRTYLTAEGNKAPVVSGKLSLGPLVDGGAVRLAAPAPVLGIAEGIETALAASKLFRVPVWAALNANRLAVWQPPAGTREVIIFADNDDNFTGQLAAFDLSARIERAIKTRIETPFDVGADWVDMLGK